MQWLVLSFRSWTAEFRTCLLVYWLWEPEQVTRSLGAFLGHLCPEDADSATVHGT